MHSAKSSHKPRAKQSLSFEAIGTGWYIEYVGENPDEDDTLQRRIHELIEDFDSTYSRFKSDSLVSRMAQQAGTYLLPSDAKPLLDWYMRLYDMSDGAVTPLIGNLLSDAGYDADYSLQAGVLRDVPQLHTALTYSFPHLIMHEPVLLDFGAAGKGYLVDLVASILEEAGCHSYIVDAGGDIRVRGKTPEKIGLEHPFEASQAIGIVNLHNASLCGSAASKRTWGKFHHIMDPKQKTSPDHIAAVWVLAETTMIADGLTTALYFTDPAELQRHMTFDYAILYRDMSLTHSRAFPATFFKK